MRIAPLKYLLIIGIELMFLNRYKQALELVRRHRVDPNIIYDHR